MMAEVLGVLEREQEQNGLENSEQFSLMITSQSHAALSLTVSSLPQNFHAEPQRPYTATLAGPFQEFCCPAERVMHPKAAMKTPHEST